MYAWSVTNLTLKRNHFYHCAIMDVFITGGDVANGGYIENNVFEKPSENTGVISNGLRLPLPQRRRPLPRSQQLGLPLQHLRRPAQHLRRANPVGSGGMRVIGNAFLDAETPCGQANTTFSYNAFVSGACGTEQHDELARHLSQWPGHRATRVTTA